MKIALLPGDGIGPEIVAEAAKLLERLRRDGLPIETETAPIGGAGYDAAGQPLPDATLKLALTAAADALAKRQISVASEYLNMGGKKFSTSRGQVIYVSDVLERYDPDALRSALSLER